nr:uridine diphosphate-glycosyltransferases 40AV1 [Glyphodes pyloalis]
MAKVNYLFVFLLCIVLIHSFSDAHKLLVIFPFPGKSHGILGEGYVRNLVKAGHEVTYIASVPLKNPYPGLRQIDVSVNFDIYPTDINYNITKILHGEQLTSTDGLTVMTLILDTMEATINNEEIQALMKNPKEKFDAVIAEWMFSEVYSGFAAVFGCPLIWSSSMEPHSMVLELIDEAPNPASSPNTFLQINSPPSFFDRIGSLLFISALKGIRMMFSSRENRVFNEGFGPAAAKRGHQLPTLNEARYSASLMLGNSYVASGQAIRLPQSYKAIGGYHIEEETKPLPEKWKKIMDEAPHGVIYFSMGTMLKSKELPKEIKLELLEVFGNLKQTVIWKFEEDLPNLPENVRIVNWAPQQSILAHPNCILFITHGGLLSTTEALHFGVPVIGIPMYGDQFSNMNIAERKGFGKRVDLSYNMSANLKAAIQELLKNPRYRDTMKRLSFVYHHRPVPPGVELVHWVDHVVQTGGAPDLRSPALAIPLYQKMYLDLIAVILIVVKVAVYIFKYLFRSKKNTHVNTTEKKVNSNKKNK